MRRRPASNGDSGGTAGLAERRGERTSGPGRVSLAREASWHVQGRNRGRKRPKPERFAVPSAGGVRTA